jgi:hypothetical protein
VYVVGGGYSCPFVGTTELVTAGMLIMAAGHDGKPLDYEALERWTRVGFERGMRQRNGER